MQPSEGQKWTGAFAIEPTRNIHGEISFDGANTSLYLYDKDQFDMHLAPNGDLNGVLHDLTKVSLLRCTPESFTRGPEGQYHSAKLYPQYVAYGPHHIRLTDRSITEVLFLIDDAAALFYDFDAFGVLRNSQPFIEEIVQAAIRDYGLDRHIPTGPDAKILYFTGKREIFSVQTPLGKVSALHSPSYNLGSPSGIWLENRILVSIAFEEPLAFDETVFRTLTLFRFLGLLIGRPQNLVQLILQILTDDDKTAPLQVYWSDSPKREPTSSEERSPVGDIILSAIQQQESFKLVLANWLEREPEWRDARLRFFNSFSNQRPDRWVIRKNETGC